MAAGGQGAEVIDEVEVPRLAEVETPGETEERCKARPRAMAERKHRSCPNPNRNVEEVAHVKADAGGRPEGGAGRGIHGSGPGSETAPEPAAAGPGTQAAAAQAELGREGRTGVGQ